MPFAIDKRSESFSGTVREVRQVSGYTYADVDGRWVVTLHRELEVGSAVSVRSFGRAADFHSAKLGTTFPQLWFAIVTQQGGTS
jgi:hypothetical protein